jgi:glutamate synthase (NADPH/NADH) large chain
VDAVKSGHNILIVSDRSIGPDRVAIPALLATSTIHQHLVSKACAPRPAWWWKPARPAKPTTSRCWPAMAPKPSTRTWRWKPWPKWRRLAGRPVGGKAIYNYTKAIGKGLMKVMSKMGISTYMSYCGAQIFEAIGLNKSLVDKYFRGTASNVEGIGVFEVAEEALRLHNLAFGNDPVLANQLDAGGEYAFRVRGEDHMWTPDAIAKLQHSTRANNYSSYKEYAQIINDQSKRHLTLRGLFEFKIDPTKAIPLDEVEPAKEIVKRFRHRRDVAGLDLDRSPRDAGRGDEPHRRQVEHRRRRRRSIALHHGAEGHQDQAGRDHGFGHGQRADGGRYSAAGGRLAALAHQAGGVGPFRRDRRIPELGRPDPDQDGAGRQAGRRRPAAGPQGVEYIAKLRFSVPGVGLISPPPHHDIYSIEDLAQLIHDLKNVNPRARSRSSWCRKWASAPWPPV